MMVVDRGAVDEAEFSWQIRRKWADATVTVLTDEYPSASMTITDAVELASLRRGAEPLRLLVLPQRDASVRRKRVIEPMPMTF